LFILTAGIFSRQREIIAQNGCRLIEAHPVHA